MTESFIFKKYKEDTLIYQWGTLQPPHQEVLAM